MNTQTVDLFEGLSEESLKETAEKIRELPEAREYKDKVEQELWELLTEEEFHDKETIAYEDLPEESRSLIGFEDPKERSLPWWLESFEWTVFFTEEDSLTLDADGLPKFVDRYSGDTYFEKPELRGDSELYSLIDGLKKLHNKWLRKCVDIDTSKNEARTELEDITIFEFQYKQSMQNHSIQTSEDFQNWINEAIRLCPPFNTATTALLYLNCGIKKNIISAFVPKNIKKVVEEHPRKSRMEDVYITNSFIAITSFDGEFDYYINPEYDILFNLEGILYESYNGPDIDGEIIKAAKEYNSLRGDSSIKDYAGEILIWPIRVSGTSFEFPTLDGSYSEKEKERAKAIADLLLEDDDA